MKAPPAPRGGGRPALVAALLLTAGFLALWLLLPDRTFVFDGMLFADVIERKGVDWRASLYNPRHLLFNASFQVLRDALSGLGVRVGAYRLVQIVNALAGAAGLWLFGGLLRRLADDDAAAVIGAALLGASWTYGTRATEGQVYMLLAFGGLATLWSAQRLLDEPSVGRALDLAAIFGVTVLFHAAGAALAPAVAAALWLAFPGRRRMTIPAAALAALMIFVPYRLHFGAEGLRGALGRGAEYYLPSESWWGGLLSLVWNHGGAPLWRRLIIAWSETARGFAVLPDGSAAAAAGLAIWCAAAAAVAAAWKALDERRRSLAAVLALAWAGPTLLNSSWSGGLFFAPVPTACLLALAAAASRRRLASWAPQARRRALPRAAAGALALAGWNAAAGLVPQSRLENNAAYSQALFIKSHTPVNSWVVIGGVVNSNLKVYIPSVSGRAREVLEYYFMANSKGDSLSLLAREAARRARWGIPQYLLGETFEERRTTDEMRRLWGVAPEEIVGAFGPGRLLTVARRPDISVHLFVPAGRRPELFAVLGYCVLTEPDPARRAESAGALRMIAADMSPAERRRTGGLLRSSQWGLDLLIAGNAPMMNEENRAAAAAAAGRYRALRGTPGFWTGAGNLLDILGLKADALEARREAARLSGRASK